MDNNENIKEKYLPLGTILKLKTGKRKLMITGFCLYDNSSNGRTLYDYCACSYPEGMLSTNEVHLFNHSDIEKVFHYGEYDEENQKFKINLTSMIQIIENVDTVTINDDGFRENNGIVYGDDN